MEGVDRGGAVLGTAEAALQSTALWGRRDLDGKQLAAFSAGDDAGVAGHHDRAGAAGECLLLRGVPCGDSDPERYSERGVEPAAVGDLGSGDAIRDIV